MTNEPLNTGNIANNTFSSSDKTWAEADFTWAEGAGTWAVPQDFENEAINTATITNVSLTP